MLLPQLKLMFCYVGTLVAKVNTKCEFDQTTSCFTQLVLSMVLFICDVMDKPQYHCAEFCPGLIGVIYGRDLCKTFRRHLCAASSGVFLLTVRWNIFNQHLIKITKSNIHRYIKLIK